MGGCPKWHQFGDLVAQWVLREGRSIRYLVKRRAIRCNKNTCSKHDEFPGFQPGKVFSTWRLSRTLGVYDYNVEVWRQSYCAGRSVDAGRCLLLTCALSIS